MGKLIDIDLLGRYHENIKNYIDENCDDTLDAELTTTVAVGKVPNGSKFPEGTSTKDILKAVLSFAAPTFSVLKVTVDGTDKDASFDVLCSGTALSLTAIKHKETNVGSISTMNYKIGSDAAVVTAKSASDQTVTVSKSITRTSKGSCKIALNGTNTLNSAMTEKSITIGYYMPVFCYLVKAANVGSEGAGIKAALASATARTEIYKGTQNIDENVTAEKGDVWCCAIPSNLDATAIGTQGDFGFGTQQTSGFTKYTQTRAYSSSNADTYTIYCFTFGSAQTNLGMRLAVKAK